MLCRNSIYVLIRGNGCGLTKYSMSYVNSIDGVCEAIGCFLGVKSLRDRDYSLITAKVIFKFTLTPSVQYQA